MKICFLNHDLENNTGAGRFLLSLTEAFKKTDPNHQFIILTSGDLLSGGFLKIVFRIFRIRSVFKSCDIIHALDGWPYGVIAAVFSLGLNRKIIITTIGTGAVQPLYQPIKKRLLIWAYRKADKIIAISNNTKREILKVVPDLKIEVINHGVDFEKFQSNDFELSPNIYKPYILSVGTLKKRKGYEYSIKAFAQIAPKFPDLKYVIVGQGPEYANLKSQISGLKLQERVIFLKDLSEEKLIGLYKNAELFILLPQDDNKDIEGFGLVFLEAAACGLPIVSSSGTSAEDAVLDGKNGLLVSPSDYLEAADAMDKILSDNNLRKSFSRESFNFAKTMDWKKVVKNYISVYRKLIML